MNPLQALDILDRAASMADLTRAEHINVQTAVLSLRQFLGNVKEKPAPSELPTNIDVDTPSQNDVV